MVLPTYPILENADCLIHGMYQIVTSKNSLSWKWSLIRQMFGYENLDKYQTLYFPNAQNGIEFHKFKYLDEISLIFLFLQ